MRARFGARGLVLLVLTPILAFYLYVTLVIAWRLLRDHRVASRGIGLALVALVAVSVGLIVAELRFGRAVHALSTAYDDGDSSHAASLALPMALPLAPSGRPERAAADAAFEIVKQRVELQPDDWRSWYELGLAYGDASDSSRGRRAMRRAIALRNGGER